MRSKYVRWQVLGLLRKEKKAIIRCMTLSSKFQQHFVVFFSLRSAKVEKLCLPM